MTNIIALEAQIRKPEENITKLRTSGFIPAVIYGSKHENQNLKIDRNKFIKVFEEAGESQLLDLSLGKEKPFKVIIKDVQFHPIKNVITHADLFQVDMTQKIEVEVSLNFIGESKAVKELGGMLVKNYDTVLVKCLPGDLVDKIDVDLSKITDYNSNITIADLNIPASMEIQGDLRQVIATAIEPEVEEARPVVAAATEQPAAGEEAKTDDKKKE